MIFNKIDWNRLEKNVSRFDSWTREQRQNWIEKLAQIIPEKEKNELDSAIVPLCYDENFLKRAGIPYSDPDPQLIMCALADHLYSKSYEQHRQALERNPNKKARQLPDKRKCL